MLVHPALIAEGEVLREFEVALTRVHDVILENVGPRLEVQGGVEKTGRGTFRAFETFGTFPLALWDKLELGCPAEGVEGFIAHITVK